MNYPPGQNAKWIATLETTTGYTLAEAGKLVSDRDGAAAAAMSRPQGIEYLRSNFFPHGDLGVLELVYTYHWQRASR